MVSVAKSEDAADCGSAEKNLVRVQIPSFTLIYLCEFSVTVARPSNRGKDSLQCGLTPSSHGRVYAGVVLVVSTSACQAGSTGSNPVTCSQMFVSVYRYQRLKFGAYANMIWQHIKR